MSRPLRILAEVSVPIAPESMQMSDCVREVASDIDSPVDGFDASIRNIAKIAAQLPDEPEQATVAEMLIVAAVASAEAYFRDMLSRIASVCPFVGERIKGQEITIGAARSYPSEMLALASLERTIFSSRGILAQELSRYVGWDPKKDPDVKAAIDAYERACACRHSIVHWRGALDSATMRDLGLNDLNLRRYSLVPEYALVQRVMAACSHLVHLVNNKVLNLTLQQWLSKGYLELDPALRDTEIVRCNEVLAVFRSRTDSATMTAETVWDLLVADQL